MAFQRMTAEDARSGADFDQAKIDITTEDDIRRHMIEDGYDPDDPFRGMVPIASAVGIRRRLNLSQEEFALAMKIPVETVRKWETGHASDPVSKSLLALIGDDPVRALRILAGGRPTEIHELTKVP